MSLSTSRIDLNFVATILNVTNRIDLNFVATILNVTNMRHDLKIGIIMFATIKLQQTPVCDLYQFKIRMLYVFMV